MKLTTITGEAVLESGEDSGIIEIKLPQFPLSNEEETVSVVIDEPSGVPAKLGSHRSCIMTVKHDRGIIK